MQISPTMKWVLAHPHHCLAYIVVLNLLDAYKPNPGRNLGTHALADKDPWLPSSEKVSC